MRSSTCFNDWWVFCAPGHSATSVARGVRRTGPNAKQKTPEAEKTLQIEVVATLGGHGEILERNASKRCGGEGSLLLLGFKLTLT